MSKFICYYRVSTKKQGDSGLGLAAQKEIAERYCQSGEIVESYTEVETATMKKNRPQLAAALQHCRRVGATLVVACLDRLSRSVAFTSALMESGAEFVCCDNPHATRLTLHILAAVAEEEAAAISKRTRNGLQQAKKRGVLLGSARPNHWEGREDRRQAGAELGGARRAQLARKAVRENYGEIMPEIVERRTAGESYAKIAAWLTSKGYLTARGKKFAPQSVKNLIKLAGSHV